MHNAQVYNTYTIEPDNSVNSPKMITLHLSNVLIPWNWPSAVVLGVINANILIFLQRPNEVTWGNGKTNENAIVRKRNIKSRSSLRTLD